MKLVKLKILLLNKKINYHYAVKVSLVYFFLFFFSFFNFCLSKVCVHYNYISSEKKLTYKLLFFMINHSPIFISSMLCVMWTRYLLVNNSFSVCENKFSFVKSIMLLRMICSVHYNNFGWRRWRWDKYSCCV